MTGSRDWTDEGVIWRVLDARKPALLVEGGARGADRIAQRWAKTRKVAFDTVKAEWDVYLQAAGAIRNRKMLKKYPGALVIAFPLPQSKGTWDCIRAALSFGHEVVIVGASGDWKVATPGAT